MVVSEGENRWRYGEKQDEVFSPGRSVAPVEQQEKKFPATSSTARSAVPAFRDTCNSTKKRKVSNVTYQHKPTSCPSRGEIKSSRPKVTGEKAQEEKGEEEKKEGGTRTPTRRRILVADRSGGLRQRGK